MPLLYIYQNKEMEIEVEEQDFAYQKSEKKEEELEEVLSEMEPIVEYKLDPNFEEIVLESKEEKNATLNEDKFERMSIFDKLTYSKTIKVNKLILHVKDEHYEGSLIELDSDKITFKRQDELQPIEVLVNEITSVTINE